MAQITILKTIHSSRGEARKLIPYIQNCDLYGPEQSLGTIGQAKLLECNWRSFLPQERSRTFIREWTVGSKLPGRNQEMEEYCATFTHYLYTNKVPLLYAERWSDQESRRLRAKKNQGYALADQGERLLTGINRQQGAALLYEGRKMCLEVSEARDRHIAENIDRLTEILPAELQQMTGDLRYTIALGARHFPERYCTAPVTVVDLVTASQHLTMLATIEDTILRGEQQDAIALILQLYDVALLAR